jgi:hypothetical protein
MQRTFSGVVTVLFEIARHSLIESLDHVRIDHSKNSLLNHLPELVANAPIRWRPVSQLKFGLKVVERNALGLLIDMSNPRLALDEPASIQFATLEVC